MKLRAILAVAVLALLTGCPGGGLSISTLKKDHDSMVQQRPPPTSEQFLALADKGISVAQDAKDLRTAATALAIAGDAARRAGPAGRDKTVTISERGKKACAGHDQEKFGTPRDCALLISLPDLAAWDSFNARVKALQDSQTSGGGRLPAAAEPDVAALNNDMSKGWPGLRDAIDQSLAVPDLPPDVRDSLMSQRRQAFCAYDLLLGVAETLPEGSPAFRPVKEGVCNTRNGAPTDVQQHRCSASAGNFSDGRC